MDGLSAAAGIIAVGFLCPLSRVLGSMLSPVSAESEKHPSMSQELIFEKSAVQNLSVCRLGTDSYH